MRFKYIGYSVDGKKITGYIDASSLKEARKRLKDAGIAFESVKKTASISFRFKKEIPRNVLMELSDTLAIYLKSGVPLAKAFEFAKEQFENSRVLDFIYQVQKQIEEGRSFYQALSGQNVYNVPSFYKESVKVAEEAGALQEVLAEISQFLKSINEIEEKTKRAMIYPGFIMIISVFIVSFMLAFIVPKITKFFTQMHQELPNSTRFVIAVGDFFASNWLYLLTGAVLAVFLFSYASKKVKSFRRILHFMALKIPVIKDIIIYSNLGKFSYLMSIMARSGVNFVHSVKLSANAMENELLKEVLQKSSKDLVEGKNFSASLIGNGFTYDRNFLRAAMLAEETSETENIFNNLSEYYKNKNASKIEVLLSMMEPILILIIGAVVGFIVSAMLMPIFSMDFLTK